MACVSAIASTSIRQGSEGTEKDRIRKSNQCASRAIELLRTAQAAGFFKKEEAKARLERDKDLEALRGRKEFKDLLAKVGKN